MEVIVHIPIERFKELEAIEEAYSKNIPYIRINNPGYYSILGLTKETEKIVSENQRLLEQSDNQKEEIRQLNQVVKTSKDSSEYLIGVINELRAKLDKKWF